MRLRRSPRSSEGFTLIELMITVAVIGIFIMVIVPVQISTARFIESEVALQKAIQVLQGQAELIRATPHSALEPGSVTAFDRAVRGLQDLVAGRGVIKIERSKDNPGLLIIDIEVHWRDARKGMRSIHTVLYRAG